MTTNTQNALSAFRVLNEEERDEYMQQLMADAELREDLFDVMLGLEALADGGEEVALEEFLAGKRTY